LEQIPFHRAYVSGRELENIKLAIERRAMNGNGPFTKACHQWLQESLGSPKAFLTPSCTAGLEFATVLLDLQPGDEVILPSFTFVSTANAIRLRGAVPVFVDIRPDTLNLDENLLEQAITAKTKAICPMHYAGVSCQMDRIMEIAKARKLWVYEDAAQAIGAKFQGRPVGTMSEMSCFSFHDTKSITCGEGGALVINQPEWIERAEIIWEKGTNKMNYLLGLVDKYSWVDVGSSYLPSELTAGFLLAQLQESSEILNRRKAIWNFYHQAVADLEHREYLSRPIVPADCEHPAHLYYMLLPSEKIRNQVLREMHEAGIGVTHHYVPLHSSAAGKRFGVVKGSMAMTDSCSSRLLRLPLWLGVEKFQADIVGRLETIVKKALA
jgi:dTDP-4-amino-4,6-dideoxygalactose transaminase